MYVYVYMCGVRLKTWQEKYAQSAGSKHSFCHQQAEGARNAARRREFRLMEAEGVEGLSVLYVANLRFAMIDARDVALHIQDGQVEYFFMCRWDGAPVRQWHP